MRILRNNRYKFHGRPPILFFIFLFPWYTLYQRLCQLAFPHVFGLDYDRLFHTQLQIYILTQACARLTPQLSNHFGSVILVPDILDHEDCNILNQTQLYFDSPLQENKDFAYRDKYIEVLKHCSQAEKNKCVILEDDFVPLHFPENSIKVLVDQTRTLFLNENVVYDCIKRGVSGWLGQLIDYVLHIFSQAHEAGLGSQCRIFSKQSADCMGRCIQEGDFKVLDHSFETCFSECKLENMRFLLGEHGALHSTMGENRVPIPQRHF